MSQNQPIKVNTPLTEEVARTLRVGDVVYLSGKIYTFRDAQHIRGHQYIQQGKPLPVDLTGQVIYHAAPAYRIVDGKYELFTAGPTTSARNNKYEAEAIRNFHFRGIIGKGGMDDATLEAIQEWGCVYFTVPSTSVLLLGKVKGVLEAYWEDLKSEALFGLQVEDFGPLLVTMDAVGNSVHKKVLDHATASLAEAYRRIGIAL